MEPVLGGRDDGQQKYVAGVSGDAPQWSPSLADGTTGEHVARQHQRCVPQWSPSLADGTTGARAPAGTDVLGAAMEPVLGGRDDVTVLS